MSEERAANQLLLVNHLLPSLMRQRSHTVLSVSDDYTVGSPLTFTISDAGSGQRLCIDLSVLDDDKVESTEQLEFYFEAIDPSRSAVVGDPATLCVNISDTDSKTREKEITSLLYMLICCLL